jgi:hypothetical protein
MERGRRMKTPDLPAHLTPRAVVAEWLCHWCATLSPTVPDHAPASQLYRDYTDWSRRFGRMAITQTAFGRALTELGIVAEKRGTGRQRLAHRHLDPRSVPSRPTNQRAA